MSQSTTRLPAGSSLNIKDLPRLFHWGLGIGLVAFVVIITSSSERTVNGIVTECSYFNYAAMGAAIACLVCAVGGGLQWLRKGQGSPANPWFVLAVAVGLTVLSGVHVLRAFGTIGGTC